jgi:hypothetical protein
MTLTKLRNIIEWAGCIIGLVLLFGGPSEIGSGYKIALAMALGLALVVGVVLLWLVWSTKRQPPYHDV